MSVLVGLWSAVNADVTGIMVVQMIFDSLTFDLGQDTDFVI